MLRFWVSVLAVACGCGIGATGIHDLLSQPSVAEAYAHAPKVPEIVSVTPSAQASGSVVRAKPSHAQPATPPRPTRLEIPRFGLRAKIGATKLLGDGSLAVPDDPWTVGWYPGSVTPGRVRSSVFVGHRDSVEGPAVFYGLGDLAPGDDIVVVDQSGVRRTFAVYRLQQVDRDRFPSRDVYEPVEDSELRLLTCAGAYEDHHYRDNLIVYARQR